MTGLSAEGIRFETAVRPIRRRAEQSRLSKQKVKL